MGSYIEVNGTLQITTAQGFPEDILNLRRHREKAITIEELKDRVFEFHNKANARVYPVAPSRCFLVHNIDGKWLYWGMIVMIEQTIQGETKENLVTSGKYKIIQIYDPEFQEEITKQLTRAGKSYF